MVWADPDRVQQVLTNLLDNEGIRAQPSVSEAGLHDWIVLSLPVMPVPDNSSPDPRPTEEWFEHLMSVRLDSEREVEMHFASPLLHEIGDRWAAGSVEIRQEHLLSEALSTQLHALLAAHEADEFDPLRRERAQ